MFKACSFGELFVKLSSAKKTFASLPDQIDFSFYSPEINFLINIANFGGKSFFITALPSNFISHAALRFLDSFRIKRSFITILKEGRLGIYFSEENGIKKNFKLIFERDDSALDKISISKIPFNPAFSKTDHYHISDFSLSLSKNIMNTVTYSARIAKEMGLKVSLSLDYNPYLWNFINTDKKILPKEAVADVALYCDYLFFSEIDVKEYFDGESRKKSSSKDKIAYYQNLLLNVSKKFPNIKHIAMLTNSSRFNNSFTRIGAALYIRETNQFFFSPNIMNQYKPVEIRTNNFSESLIETFSAGFVYAASKYKSIQHVLDFALSAAVLKYSYEGEYNYSTFGNVSNYMHKELTKNPL